MSNMSLLILLGAAVSASIGQILFKVGAQGKESLLEFINLPIIVGLACYSLSTVLWISALSKEKLVDVYAFTALTFVLVYLAGVFVLGETLRASAMVGVVLVLGGLYMIVQSS